MARQGKPWFRASKQTWYLTLNGKKVSLGVQGEANEKEAVKAWHRLLGGMPLATPHTPAEPNEPPQAAPTPAVKPVSVQEVPAEGVNASEAEEYARKPEWSSSYRNGFLGTLVTAYRWAERSQLIARSPLNGVRKPQKASRGSKAIVSAEAHAALVKVAPKPFRAFLELLWLPSIFR